MRPASRPRRHVSSLARAAPGFVSCRRRAGRGVAGAGRKGRRGARAPPPPVRVTSSRVVLDGIRQ